MFALTASPYIHSLPLLVKKQMVEQVAIKYLAQEYWRKKSVSQSGSPATASCWEVFGKILPASWLPPTFKIKLKFEFSLLRRKLWCTTAATVHIFKRIKLCWDTFIETTSKLQSSGRASFHEADWWMRAGVACVSEQLSIPLLHSTFGRSHCVKFYSWLTLTCPHTYRPCYFNTYWVVGSSSAPCVSPTLKGGIKQIILSAHRYWTNQMVQCQSVSKIHAPPPQRTATAHFWWCQQKMIIVNFAEIGWMAELSYWNAVYCTGVPNKVAPVCVYRDFWAKTHFNFSLTESYMSFKEVETSPKALDLCFVLGFWHHTLCHLNIWGQRCIRGPVTGRIH